MILLWVLAAFLCGSLPLSYWLGKTALHVDIRAYGDGNPGAANIWRAGGKWWGLAAVALDFLKGALPVAMAVFAAGISGWDLLPIVLAPVLGHAYTPFLRFNGGKALAVTFGVWCGLSLYEIPIVLGLAFAFWLLTLHSEAWAVLAGSLTLLAFLLLTGASALWLGVWAGTSAILIWKQRRDFSKKPRLQDGLFGRYLH